MPSTARARVFSSSSAGSSRMIRISLRRDALRTTDVLGSFGHAWTGGPPAGRSAAVMSFPSWSPSEKTRRSPFCGRSSEPGGSSPPRACVEQPRQAVVASAPSSSVRRVCSVPASTSDSAVLSYDEGVVLNDARDMHASRRWNSAEKKAESWRRSASICLCSLWLNANECVPAHICNCNVASRDRHDDFADQTDDAGIGATRYWPHSTTSKRYNCTFYRQ